jgi:hypothetical protein
METNPVPEMDVLLHLIRCPITHESLAELAEDELRHVNKRIDAGEVLNRANDRPATNWLCGLVNASRSWIYPVLPHGVTLIADEAVSADVLRL